MFRNMIPGSLTEIRWQCSRVGTPILGCSWIVQASVLGQASVGLLMEGSREATRPVDSRVLAAFTAAAVSPVAVSMEEEEEEDSMEVVAAMEAVTTDKRRE